MGHRDPPLPPADLRRRAEQQALARGDGPGMHAPEDALGLVHELQVHQIELELQNEELRRARDAAEESAARYTELYNFAPVGYLTLDAEGVILQVNLAGAALLGAARAEVVRRRLPGWLPPEARATLAQLLATVRRDAKGACDLQLLPAGQAPRFVHLDAATEAPARSAAWCCRAALTDVTEQKAAAQLRESDRRKGEFLAMLSHELRNPLAPISNAIQILERAPAGSAQASGAVAILRRQTSHLTRLVDDLLDLERISHGKIGLRPEVVDLRELARRARDDHRAGFEQRGVDLGLDEPASPVFVRADPARLVQVVGNLLFNAAKFTGAPGAVRLSVAACGDRAEIRVRDSGVGIDPAELEHLFEPFVQVADGMARTAGGLGLGLSLVRGLVELHGGTVRGTSEGIGHGAEFVVSLPLSAPAPAPVAARAPRPPPRSVVLIEDNADAALTFADLLALGGHRVEVALDGHSGVELVRRVRPDVVFCDLGLPDLDGFEVAAALRGDASLRGTRLVALSGYSRPEDLARAREAGFDAHLSKPADLEAVAALLLRASGTP